MTTIECVWARRSWWVDVQVVHPHFSNKVASDWMMATVDTGAVRSHIPASHFDNIKRKYGFHFPQIGYGVEIILGGGNGPKVPSPVYATALAIRGGNGAIVEIKPEFRTLGYDGYIGVFSTPNLGALIGVDVLVQSKIEVDGINRKMYLHF